MFPNTDSNPYANTNKDNIKNIYMNIKELTTDENPYDNTNVNTEQKTSLYTNVDVPYRSTFKDWHNFNYSAKIIIAQNIFVYNISEIRFCDYSM